MVLKESKFTPPDDEEDELSELHDSVDIILYNLNQWQTNVQEILNQQKITIDSLMQFSKITLKTTDAHRKQIARLIKNQQDILKLIKE